jgi:hypothetical protein
MEVVVVRVAMMLCCLSACGQLAETPEVLPLADAGNDQLRRFVGYPLLIGLDARGSCDPLGNDIDSYSWTLSTRPRDSQAILAAANTQHPTFFADIEGRYEVNLVVAAHGVASETDRALIEFRSGLAQDTAPTVPLRNRCGEKL